MFWDPWVGCGFESVALYSDEVQQPATILTLLSQDVLAKRELRSHHDPHAVATAIQ
jgi:hypothetical protein